MPDDRNISWDRKCPECRRMSVTKCSKHDKSPRPDKTKRVSAYDKDAEKLRELCRENGWKDTAEAVRALIELWERCGIIDEEQPQYCRLCGTKEY